MFPFPIPSPRGPRLALALALGAALCSYTAAASADDGGARPMPPEWVLAHTCGHLGNSCDATPARGKRIRLRVAPARAAAGRRTVFRLRVRGRRRSVRAVISFAGRRVRTDARGRALIVARPAAGGRLSAVARSARLGSARASVRVVD